MATTSNKTHNNAGILSGRERTPGTRISAILFDLDNTLIPTRQADDLTAQKISEKIAHEFRIPVQTAREAADTYLRRFRRNVENPRMSIDDWRILLWCNALGEEYEEYAEEIYRKWKRMRYRHLGVTESTFALLRTLRKEYQLALITNGPSKSQWEKIRELNLEDYFDFIAVSGDIGSEKPERKIFRTVCTSLGVEPFECLIVGDKLETDIKGGYDAKLGITVWLPPNLSDIAKELQNASPQPDFVIRDVSELPGLLGRSKKNERTKPATKSVKMNRNAATKFADQSRSLCHTTASSSANSLSASAARSSSVSSATSLSSTLLDDEE